MPHRPQTAPILPTAKTHLEEFARKYKNEIKKNPEFRQQFQTMCGKIGVDPLQSNKGVWAELLGVDHEHWRRRPLQLQWRAARVVELV